MNFLSLPSDILQLILRANSRDLNVMKRICKKLYTVVNETYEKCSIYCTLEADVARVLHRRVPFLVDLCLSYIDPPTWNRVACNCPFLTSLSVLNSVKTQKFDPVPSSSLLSIPLLRSLTVGVPGNLFMLPACPGLTYLSVNGLNIMRQDLGFEHLMLLTRLETLNIECGLDCVTHWHLDHIVRFLNQQVGGSLRALSNHSFGDEIILFTPVILRLLPQLTTLKVQVRGGDDSLAREVVRHPQLTSVSLGYSNSLDFYPCLPNLTSVSFSSLNGAEQMLATLSRLPHLRTIRALQSSVSSVWDQLPVCTSLTSLTLHASNLSLTHLLRAYPQLQTIRLSCEGDLDLTHLVRFTSLRALSITLDSGATVVASLCTSLTTLSIRYHCDLKLLELLPNLTDLNCKAELSLVNLRNLTALTSLKVHAADAETLIGLQWITPNLQVLHITVADKKNDPLDDLVVGFAFLRYLTNLRLKGGPVSGVAMEKLLKRVPLRSLTLRSKPSTFDIDCLIPISTYGKSLRFLDIRGGSEAGVPRVFYMAGCLAPHCLRTVVYVSARDAERNMDYLFEPALTVSVEDFSIKFDRPDESSSDESD